jgi:sigma-E factor negative regulatory protein RseA
MTDSTENLSCLMDGELDTEGQRFLLRRLSDDATMTLTWRRYHLVRACLHQEMSSPACIADRVAAALREEQVPRVSGMNRWFRPVAGGAIAASAALFAIVAINSSLMQRTQELEQQPGFIAQPTVLDQPFSLQAVPVSLNEMSSAQRQRISTYVLRHNQAAGGSGFVSYLPIVTGGQGERIEREPVASEPAPALQESNDQGR